MLHSLGGAGTAQGLRAGDLGLGLYLHHLVARCFWKVTALCLSFFLHKMRMLLPTVRSKMRRCM